ncbi:hypothetical protein BC827DRAFT_1385286 [Russula dissimulans]|nr:hypothetical protein BC827DRAFT_1385286 [Russula dissimulans]
MAAVSNDRERQRREGRCFSCNIRNYLARNCLSGSVGPRPLYKRTRRSKAWASGSTLGQPRFAPDARTRHNSRVLDMPIAF